MVNFTKKCLIAALSCVLLTGTASAASHVRVYVNGMRVNEDVILQNDRTYVPLRAVSEAMGAQVDWDGNTSSASIPIALHELAKSGKLHRGDKIILTAFGAGLASAACLITW